MQDCGTCTLCCIFPKIVEMNSIQGEYCKECIPNEGCKVYENRPESCKIFQCAWSQMENVHIDLRPDKCGIMFEKINDTLILGSVVGEIKHISSLVKRQIKFFGRENISVMLQQFNPFKYVCYCVSGANKEEIVKALEEKSK